MTDNNGATGSASVAITVQSGNRAPVASAGLDQVDKDPGTAVTLGGTGSSGPDGNTLSYSWTRTAGPAVNLAGANTATASFTAPGATTAPFTFPLTVTDNGSPSLSAQDLVIVSTRVPHANTIRNLFADRGTQSNGNRLGCFY